MLENSFGRLEHALVVLEDVLPDDLNVVLGFGRCVSAFGGERKAEEQKHDFFRIWFEKLQF